MPDTVMRLPFATILHYRDAIMGEAFEVWKWNVFLMRWTKLSMTDRAIASLELAQAVAQSVSDEIQTMLDCNREHPPEM